MNLFPTSKPYGVVGIVGHKALCFHAGARLHTLFSPHDYVYLHPHWYHANEQRVLQWVGKSAIPARQLASATVGEQRLDLEVLLNHAIPQHQAFHIPNLAYLVFLDLRLPAQALDLGGETAFPPRGFVVLGDHLYKTDQRGRLEHIGDFSGPAMRHEPTFRRRFKELTGIDPQSDVQPLGVAQSERAR